MAIDYSFVEEAASKQTTSEPVKPTSNVNLTIRVDADCMMQCDGEYVDVQLKAGMMVKIELPCGQHLLEFISTENPNVKVEKIGEWPEPGKNYLVIVNELKALIAPPMPQSQTTQNTPPTNSYLDQLNQMAQMNPLSGINGMPSYPPMPDKNSKK